MSLVENSIYRARNLGQNDIYLRPLRAEHPKYINTFTRSVNRDISTSLSLDQIREDPTLNRFWEGESEENAECYFTQKLLTIEKPDSYIQRDVKLPMGKDTIADTKSDFKVSGPRPDILYGYQTVRAFTEEQQGQFWSMGESQQLLIAII